MVIAGFAVTFAVLVVFLDGSVLFEVAVCDRVVVAAISVIFIPDVVNVKVVELGAVVSAFSGGEVIVD